MSKEASPWADYLDARLRLVQEWHREGIPSSGETSAAAIAAHLNRHDEGQINLLIHTDAVVPIPGSSRWLLQRQTCVSSLLATAKRYERGDLDQAEMLADVAAIVGRLP